MGNGGGFILEILIPVQPRSHSGVLRSNLHPLDRGGALPWGISWGSAQNLEKYKITNLPSSSSRLYLRQMTCIYLLPRISWGYPPVQVILGLQEHFLSTVGSPFSFLFSPYRSFSGSSEIKISANYNSFGTSPLGHLSEETVYAKLLPSPSISTLNVMIRQSVPVFHVLVRLCLNLLHCEEHFTTGVDLFTIRYRSAGGPCQGRQLHWALLSPIAIASWEL